MKAVVLTMIGFQPMETIKKGKYADRLLANIRTVSGEQVAPTLISEGYARPYKGGKRKGWCNHSESPNGAGWAKIPAAKVISRLPFPQTPPSISHF